MSDGASLERVFKAYDVHGLVPDDLDPVLVRLIRDSASPRLPDGASVGDPIRAWNEPVELGARADVEPGSHAAHAPGSVPAHTSHVSDP